jgi:hypothetical protein
MESDLITNIVGGLFNGKIPLKKAMTKENNLKPIPNNA